MGCPGQTHSYGMSESRSEAITKKPIQNTVPQRAIGRGTKGLSRHISCVRIFRSCRRGPHTCVCRDPFHRSAPVTFTAAKTICDAEQSSRRSCGYVVNESTTGLMDGRFFRESCMRANSFELDYEAALDELLEENLERWGINCAAGIAPNGNYSAALFTVPSGVYYWYWGKDPKGEICCLTADFFTYL